MADFENNEELLEYLSDSTINSILGNAQNSDSENSENETTEEDEDISFSNSEDEDESISDMDSEGEEEDQDEQPETDEVSEHNEEAEHDEDAEHNEDAEILENYKTGIHGIIHGTILCNKQLEELNILNQESLKTLYYYENKYKENYDFKSYALRIIFTKIIILKFKNSVELRSITNLHITLDPLEITIEGLNAEDTKLMKDFFIMYLESK